MSEEMQAEMTSQARPSVLPEPWVDRLFGRLEGLYGAKFHDLWRGSDIENVKRTWAEKLGGFGDRPEALKAALDACDDKPWPPTLPEFLGLCRDAAKRTGPAYAALPAPEIDQAEAARRVEQATAAVKKPDAYDWLGWAKRLRTRYLGGERLLPVQIDMASSALGESWALGSIEIT
ncbi:MAG: hypothetical protein KGL39_56025 [Patescibacteria group bacterium]|nr:hypothetical protein [Patescibacteria group bacterium]